jgi:pimeloyl-ACP methyl ester carboxylesterase
MSLGSPLRAPSVLLAGALALLSSACGSGSEDDMAPDAPPIAPADATLSDAAALPDGGSANDAAPWVPEAGALPVEGGVNGDAGAALPDAGGVRSDAAVGVPRPPDPGVITWRSCAGDTRDCGTMQVPLDYADAAAGSAKLAIMRRRASGQRLGTLLLNPGGPGSSAIDFLGVFVEDSTSPLLDRFDLVAFDPRGIGYSVRIECHATLQQLYAADPSPDDEAEWKAADDAAAKFAADCAEAHAALLPHVGTLNVARDMERVREALGESKLNYLGFSYGTSIGARYAELYPSRVGALVLDAAVDLGLGALDLALEQAKGFERALGRYFDWCKAAADRCTWVRGAEPAQAFRQLAAAIDAQSIAAPAADRRLGPGEYLTAVGATMYGGELGWRALSAGLDKAVAGDGSTLLEYVDGYLQRELDGSYSNREEANHAVNCLDRRPLSVAEIRAATARFASEAPFFGLPALTGQLVCAHWSVQGQDLAVPKGKGAPPLIVVGTRGDPATPYAWSQALAEDLESAVLLTSNGEGHTGYGRGDRCVDDAVHAYLFDALVPPENLCGSAPLPRALFARGSSARWRYRAR